MNEKNMIADKMSQAESVRYAKIQRLIGLLCGEDKTILDGIISKGFTEPFDVGRKITIDGETIWIKNKSYTSSELQKIIINTEGSLAVYDSSGRKICGWLLLNVSVKNIELFCVWARKYHVQAETVSGKHERIFQWGGTGADCTVGGIIQVPAYF